MTETYEELLKELKTIVQKIEDDETSLDESIALWRARHVLMVERMIGAKRGTGGSEGVGYLRSTLPKRGFPDLWAVRSALGGGYGQAGA